MANFHKHRYSSDCKNWKFYQAYIGCRIQTNSTSTTGEQTRLTAFRSKIKISAVMHTSDKSFAKKNVEIFFPSLYITRKMSFS